MNVPTKFVFYVRNQRDTSTRYMFDLTKRNRKDEAALYDWIGDAPGEEVYWGWDIPSITQNILNGDWVVEVDLTEPADMPEVGDLL